MATWAEQGYTPEQVRALTAAEEAVRNYGRKRLTKKEWDRLAEQAYDPAKESEQFRGSKDTEQVFKRGEEWTEEREQLHVQLIQGVLGEKPGKDQPTLILLGGGPASGKSFLREQELKNHPDAVIIDPDEFKRALPEFEEFRKSDPLRAAARLHEESSYLAKTALEAAMLQGNDILLDVVSGNPQKVAALIKRFQDEGYAVQVRFVDAPVETAMERMADRAKKTGRWVPPTILEEGHLGAAATFFRVEKSAESAQFWRNANGGPSLVAERKGGAEAVYNEGWYEEYKAKAAKHG